MTFKEILKDEKVKTYLRSLVTEVIARSIIPFAVVLIQGDVIQFVILYTILTFDIFLHTLKYLHNNETK